MPQAEALLVQAMGAPLRGQPNISVCWQNLTSHSFFLQVEALLAQAMERRSVGSTQLNENSSRSHMVFTLRIDGQNSTTGKWVGGCLLEGLGPQRALSMRRQVSGFTEGSFDVGLLGGNFFIWLAYRFVLLSCNRYPMP